MIKIYVYQKLGGRLLYKSFGLPEYVIHDTSPDHDFTLTVSPMVGGVYRCIDNKWVKDAD